MTQEDINDTIADHVHSAKCAIEAGFDGVEIVSPDFRKVLRPYLRLLTLPLMRIARRKWLPHRAIPQL